MGIRVVVMIMAVFIFPCLVFADEPQQQGVDSQLSVPEDSATWVNFEVNSDFGTYIAQIKALDGQQNISADKKAYTLMESFGLIRIHRGISLFIAGECRLFWKSLRLIK